MMAVEQVHSAEGDERVGVTCTVGWIVRNEEDPLVTYLVKPVHIVRQQVDYLACGGLPYGRVTQAKGLK